MSGFMAELLGRLAPRMGASFVVEEEFRNTGYVTFGNGKRVFFRDNRFDLNPVGSVKVVQDKAHTATFLKHFGYATPEGMTFWKVGSFRGAKVQRHVEDAVAFARRVGWPVWVKPNDASQGKGVYCCFDEQELHEAAEAALAVSSVLLVQSHAAGKDWRVVVLDGEVISAYERIPLAVVGDGSMTVAELMAARQEEFRRSGRDTTLREDDRRILRCLKRVGMGMGSVPERGKVVRLQDVSNLSAGGECRDVTAAVREGGRGGRGGRGGVAELCRRIAEDFRLRLCGVDLAAGDITAGDIWAGEMGAEKYQVIELNSAPGLDNYAHGDAQQQERLVDELYLKLLRAVEKPGAGL